MFWEGEQLLHMGWADTVKVARVHAPAASSASGEARRSLDIVASFQIEGCLIAVSFAPIRCSQVSRATVARPCVPMPRDLHVQFLLPAVRPGRPGAPRTLWLPSR